MAKEKRETFIRLNSHLANLQSAPDITPTAQQVLEEQRKELNLLLRHQARGALVRSRFQHINEIDTSSTYFFNLKKSHSKSKTLLCIRLRDGELTENPEKINYRCWNFYKNLYSVTPTDESALETLLANLSSLDPLDARDLDVSLRSEELDAAVKLLNKNTTSEFFISFWYVFKHDLFDVLNLSITTGSLPLTFLKAAINLIPKKGDIHGISN